MKQNPIISELIPFCAEKPALIKYKFELSEGDPDCIGHPKLYSHTLIERILEELGLISLFSSYKQLTNYEFDLTGFFRLLVYGRILNPSSKIKTINQNDDYYNPIINNPYKYNIYDTLDFVYDYQNSIINKINKSLVSSFNRTTNIIYYDVTNFFFEIERPDDDDEDENGEIQKGLRKYGVSKEERKLPITQMGLFMDEQGIPISIETFPGNTLDHLTMVEALKSTVNKLDLPRFIFVGDRGMYRGTNTAHLINNNNGYIISKSIEKTAAKEKEWIYSEDGYVFNGENFKYKSRTFKRSVKTEDGKKQNIVEKVLVYWSKKFYDKQVAENKSFLDFLEKLEKTPENFKITRTQSANLKKFLKKDCVNDKTGEVIDSKDIKMKIDNEKVNRYKESFGYYQIVTSELEMEDLEIINAYKGLSKIEDQFRTMKGDLQTRPLHVRTPEHIKSHLLICMISLIVLRIIQNKIAKYKGESKDRDWEMGLSGNRIQKALNKWTVDYLTNGYYRFNNIDDTDSKLILNSFEIDIPVKLYKKAELRTIKTNIKI